MANARKTPGKTSKTVERGDTARKPARGTVKAQEIRRELLRTADQSIAALDRAEGTSQALLACPVCGSKRLAWVSGGADAIFDRLGAATLSGVVTCRNCLQTVLPIEFSSEEEREEYAANHTPSNYVMSRVRTISLARGIAHGVIPLWLMLSAVGLLALYVTERSILILALAGILGIIGVYLMAPRK